MHRALIVLAAITASSSVSAAEIPARFRGVWANLAAGDAQCRAADWKGVGHTDDDRLVQVTARAILFFESGCDVRSAATAAVSAGSNRMEDGPTTLSLACSGEGSREAVRETWDITRAGGEKILITSQIGKPRISKYVRCR